VFIESVWETSAAASPLLRRILSTKFTPKDSSRTPQA